MQLEISNSFVIKNCDKGLISALKSLLTLDNPAYEKVKRYSRYAYTRVPKFLTYYQASGNEIEIPIGIDLSKISFDKIADERVMVSVKYPKFVLELRQHQKEAVRKYVEKNVTDCGIVNRFLVQLATGKGKSILGIYLASLLCQRTLIVVHKDDLVKGWQDDIKLAFNGELKSGLIKAKKFEIGEQITIATIQTLSKLPEETLNSLLDKFGFVIVDECQHTPSTTFSVIDKFKARYRLGLTATPERSDGLTPVLKFYFGGFCYKYKSTENDEDILPVEVMRVPIYEEYEPKVSGNKAVYNIYDFDVVNAGLKNISDIPFERRPKVSYMEIDNAVVLHNLKEYAKYVVFEYEMGRSCLVFFNKKEQCRIFRDYLIKECWVDPDSIGLYYGDNKDNDSVKREAEAKRKYITIATYSKATEGTNVVQWEVAFLIGSLNNGKNVEQAIGRIRRRSKDKEKKLWVARVYDFDYLNTYVLRNHYATRRERYLKLHFTVKPFLI